ncbi:hypothetical protein LguiA_022560 [Lonicera macranthoides]
MGRMARCCAQSLLKLVNSVMGMVGISMILYALWMFRVWQKEIGDSDYPAPWFIYTFFGVGVTLCVISCWGHIGATTVSGCCLYFYMVFVFLLLVLEAAVTVDVFLNHNWQEDFPKDETGKLDDLKDFIKENFDVCKWIGLSVVAVQGLCVLLAMILKALGPHREISYESDDEYTSDRVPLLKNYVRPPYVVDDSVYGSKNDSWSIGIKNKVNR